jgi:integrase
MNTRDRLYAAAIERGLRRSTVLSYHRLMKQLGVLDLDPTREEVMAAIWTIDNPNTRRAAVIAVRSIFKWDIKIPKAVPRRYVLPSEDTLRLALMTSPQEARGLLMMYAGLRLSEACAITYQDVSGDRLTVNKQYQELHETGKPTTYLVGPLKSACSDATIVIPHFLTDVVLSLSEMPKPSAVRESLRRAGWKVGVHLTPHSLRHWYATTMIDRGVPLPLVQKQMRHSDIAVTLRTYVQFNAEGTIHETFG